MGQNFKLSFEGFRVAGEVKLLEHGTPTVVLDGQTSEHDGLLGQPVLLVNNEGEEQVHVGRVLHILQLVNLLGRLLILIFV